MLSERQKKFADLFIMTGNAKQSYIDAGYKAKDNVAEAAASRLLRDVKVKEYIEQRNKQLEQPRIATMEEVKRFWAETMRDENIDRKDRLKASEYIAKTNAAFIDKVQGEMNHAGSVEVNHNLSKLSVQELKNLESILSKTSDC